MPPIALLSPGATPWYGGSSPWTAPVVAVVSMLLASLVWWLRERRITRLRAAIRRVHELSEGILGFASPAEMLRGLGARLDAALGAAEFRVWLANPQARTLDPLDSVSAGGQSAARVRPLPLDGDGPPAPVVRAWREAQILLQPSAGDAERSLLLPMLAQGETCGVLELRFAAGDRRFQPDELAALQHLANQAAIALRLLDQKQLREHLLRGEKAGAAGHLVAVAVGEMRAPLELIRSLSSRLPPENSPAIAAAAARAMATLDRLESFGGPAQAPPRPVALHGLLRELAEFRRQTLHVEQIDLELELGPDEVWVFGHQGQMEQAILCLILHAEQTLADAPERSIRASTHARAGLVELHLDYSGAAAADPFDEAAERSAGSWSMTACRAIFSAHDGQVHHRRTERGCRFEITLPVSAAPTSTPAAAPAAVRVRPMTILLLEPEAAAQRDLLARLASRGHRVVPCANGLEALERAERMRFDATFSTTRPPDLKWTDLYEQLRRSTPLVVLLAEAADTDPAQGLFAREAAVLLRPVEDAALDGVLESLSARLDALAEG